MKQQKAPRNAREAAGDWLKFEITEVEARDLLGRSVRSGA